MKLTLDLPSIPVRASEITIEEGILERLPERLSEHRGTRLDYWVWDKRVWELWHEQALAWGWTAMESGRVFPFEASESNKRLAAVETMARQLVRAGADRHSVLVAVGGGVTGDMVGFLASIYMRGIPHFQVPTTLLAQVDSSVGGKTGVDLPEGKNLLGTFHQPRQVWIDPQILDTLPQEQLRQGMAEVIKTAMLGDEALWSYLEKHTTALQRRERDKLLHIIAASCRVKANVVMADETEQGRRRILNLGHTVGHALERLSDYRIAHGDAVAMGMLVAAQIAVRMGSASLETLTRLERLCTAWDLPVHMPRTYTPEAVCEALKTDKKRIGERLHFILPVRIGSVKDCDDLDWGILHQAIEARQG